MNTMLHVDDLLELVGEISREIGLEVYLVGGFVRDRLMGAGVSKDIDMVVVSDGGDRLLGAVAHRLGWAPPQTFDRFGTAQVRGGGFILEVVRARAERYDPLSRQPEVRPGTLTEDVWRRDFTVNALCQTLEGEVLDITGRGLDDLGHGVLRTPLEPGETFSEDPLRMFRAARFRSQLGFVLAEGMLQAMRAEAHRAQILSVERIADELRRLLTSAHPRAGMEVCREGGLLEVALPEVAAMSGVEQSGFHIYDVYDHTTHALDLTARDPITRLATLLHDVGKPVTHEIAADGRHTFHGHDVVGAAMASAILTRLRCSNEEIQAVTTLVRLHLRPIQYRGDRWSDAAVRRLIHDVGELRGRMLDVARADTRASSYPDVDNIDELEARMTDLDRGGDISRLTAAITGEELMAMTGRGPGRWIGVVKRALEEATLEGEIPAGDAGAARRWLESHPHLLDGG